MLFHAASMHARYYQLWIRETEPLRFIKMLEGPQINIDQAVQPLIITGASTDARGIDRTCTSLHRVFGLNITILVIGAWSDTELLDTIGRVHLLAPESGIAAAIQWMESNGSARYIMPIFAGDSLAPQAGQLIGDSLRKDPTLAYWDEDQIDTKNRRSAPWLKPEWNFLHFLAQDYLAGACLFKVDTALACLPATGIRGSAPAELAQFLIRMSVTIDAQPHRAFRIPFILLHRATGSPAMTAKARAAAINEIVPSANAEPGLMNATRIRWPLQGALPSVSIVIPTRDRVDLLKVCIEGLGRLDYGGRVEIIIMDNDSTDPTTLCFLNALADRGFRIIQHAGPFNFAAMNNQAAKAATGDFLCLMNNDVEPRNGSWLTLMVEHAARPGVGAVGIRLLYPDLSIQHAGLVIGIGGAAGHVFRGLPAGSTAYHGAPHITRYVTGVTAACLVISRESYLAAGGFDAEAFAVAFNDVDFCLRLDRAGFRNVYVAEAELIHYESKSRGNDLDAVNFVRYSKELSILQSRWGTQSYLDRYYHPSLSRASERPFLSL